LFIGVDYLSVAPVPSYEPGTGAGLANVPFYGLGSLESAPRVITAGNRVVLVPGVGRVDAWRNERRIDRRPIDGRDLLRAIAALGEHGTVRKARPVRLRSDCSDCSADRFRDRRTPNTAAPNAITARITSMTPAPPCLLAWSMDAINSSKCVASSVARGWQSVLPSTDLLVRGTGSTTCGMRLAPRHMSG